MSLDAAAARREARRRKILENSEKRLTKIVSCENSRSGDVATTIPTVNNQWEHCNGVINSEVSAKPEELEHLDELSKPLQGSSQDEIAGDTFEVPEETEINNEFLLPGETLTASEIVEDKTQVLFWSDCFFIVAVSVMVRFLYALKMSSMFAESLFVPFVTIFAAKLAANPSKHTTKSVQYGGMIRASLLLSGVPKDWLDTIFLCIQMCVDLGHDFALYFFSFTITHIFLESFVNR